MEFDVAPVIVHGIETPVWSTGQLLATLPTLGLAAFALVSVALLGRHLVVAPNAAAPGPVGQSQ
jgi:hypothetical protein